MCVGACSNFVLHSGVGLLFVCQFQLVSVPSREKGKHIILMYTDLLRVLSTCLHKFKLKHYCTLYLGRVACFCTFVGNLYQKPTHAFLTMGFYIVQHNPFLTKTFLLRSKHQLSNNTSILAKSASITGEAGDSTGDRDDDVDDSCSASGV